MAASEQSKASTDTNSKTAPPPLFLQLYVDKNRANSERLLKQALALGVRAVFVTVDAPVPGKREADERVPALPSVASSSPISGAAAGLDRKSVV